MPFLTGFPPESTRSLGRWNWGEILDEHIRRMGRVDDTAYLERGKHFVASAYEDICHQFHHFALDASTPPELKLTVPEDDYTWYTQGYIQVQTPPSQFTILGVGTAWQVDNIDTDMPMEIGIGSGRWVTVDMVQSNTQMTVDPIGAGFDLNPTPKISYRILLIDPDLNPAIGFSPATIVIPPGVRRVRLPDDLYIVFQPQILQATPEDPEFYTAGTVTIDNSDPDPAAPRDRVEGSATFWQSSDIRNGLPIEIPANSGKWYTIDYIEGEGVLYLTEDFPFEGVFTSGYRILQTSLEANLDASFLGVLTYNEAHRHFADLPTLGEKPGQPKEATRYGQWLYFERPTDKQYLMSLLYYRHPTPPNFGTDPQRADARFPEIDRVWDEHVIEHSLYLAHKALFRPDLAEQHEAAFQAFAEQMPQIRTILGSLRQHPEQPTRTFPHGGEQG